MGNKLSCSCAPLVRKGYRYEDTPWQNTRRRDGHLLRLWAEVFHVSGQGGAVKWQQVSEDLVPVNITCIQDSPDCVFHITAYNSQVDKILDVRLVQPGTRLGQASECFVYWKDSHTGDTWGLNFTSPLDAKQFRECCSPAFKFCRKASSSYSLKLEPPKKSKNSKRKPQSTPSSPSRGRSELQCTCMTAENLHRARNGRVRYTGGAATLPRAQQLSTRQGLEHTRSGTSSSQASARATARAQAVAAALTASSKQQQQQQQQDAASSTTTAASVHGSATTSRATASGSAHRRRAAAAAASGSRSGGGGESNRLRDQYASRKEQAKSVDYSPSSPQLQASGRSKSSDNVFEEASGSARGDLAALSLDSNTLKRMLDPLPPSSSSSPDQQQPPPAQQPHMHQQQQHRRSVPSVQHGSTTPRLRDREHRSESGRRRSLERSVGLDLADGSPPSDHFLYDNLCYATTPPSSSNDTSSDEGGREAAAAGVGVGGGSGGGSAVASGLATPRRQASHEESPTSKLLMEYETHLRNALARGMDAESYSLHTFEALLTQSMENVAPAYRNRENMEKVALMREVHVELEAIRKEEQALKTHPNLHGFRGLLEQRLAASSGRPSSAGPSLSAGGSLSSRRSTLLSQAGTASSLSVESNHALFPQASLESTDSRVYLTSSEMSDDERLSLTTAVSDEDETGEPRSGSRAAGSGGGAAAAASFNCTGAVRKAGFLSVKKWLLRRRHQVELARKRGWKGYWVCLKGTTLLFYPCDSRDGRAIDSTPKHLIIVDGAVMQPVPEHPKRDYVFCLSTAFGDAYLFQAPCQVELENWINSIHSACAAAFARHRGRTGTLHLLQEEIFRLEKEIESDAKLKHMAELQLTVVVDQESRQTLSDQIGQWEENLERLHCEQFRLRCYMASLQVSELPNPKNLLTHVSKATKATLNKLGVFTVSSFHAYICARSPSLLTNLLSGRGATKRRSRAALSRSNSSKLLSMPSSSLQSSLDLPALGEKSVKINLPDNQAVIVGVRDNMTVEEVLWVACSRRQLSPNDHFLRFRRRKDSDDCYVAARTEIFDNLSFESLEVCAKVLYQVGLSRSSLDQLFGFSVEAELVENTDHQDELCVYVSRVEEGSLAHQQGLMKGDEIMVINGAIVSDLDMMYIECVLQEELSLCMMMRSSRTEPPDLASAMRTTDDYIESLVCPPPPSDSVLSDEMIGKLIVPSPIWGSQERSPDTSGRPTPSPVPPQDQSGLSCDQIESLLKVIEDSCKKTAEQVTEYCRVPVERRRSSLAGGLPAVAAAAAAAAQQPVSAQPPLVAAAGAVPGAASIGQASKHMSDVERLRKVVLELVDTERTYVKHMSELVEWYVAALQKRKPPSTNEVSKHLNNLLEHYLEPMKKETLLSNAEISALFGNIQEIVKFQRQFLQSLEEAIAAEPDFHRLEHPSQFKNVLFALGNSFLYYADQFKLYSSFCASHSKAQKVLHPSEGNTALSDFLQTRNPRGQHSFSLESYLIKPIQRILKYPLLLQQLKHLTDPVTEEHHHLAEALKGMERVAEHINEMQRIHEEYGAIFDHLYRQHVKSSKQHVDLSPGELLYYGGVEWLNISEFLGKIKKGLELHAMCFVFKTAVVFLCKERIRQKKKLMGGSSKNNSAEVEIIRYQVLIPVTEVQVRASSQKDADSHYLWELVHLKSQIQRRSEKVYQLSNSTSEFRNAFLRTIRQIIRESVRNMTVPATRPAVREKPGTLRRLGGNEGSGAASAASAMPSTSSMSRTLSGKKRNKSSQRHSAGDAIETYDNVPSSDPRLPGPSFRGTRSRTVADSMNGMSASARELAAAASEEDSERSDRSDRSEPKAPTSLSSASSLSSSGATARLIQSSQPPSSYQPPAEQAGSPVWKPRASSADRAGPSGLNRPDVKEQFFVYEDYGGAAVYQQRSQAQQQQQQQQQTPSSSKQSEC
ncbi:guanine nucleotide exchange factor still life isoform X8 [Dermacentor variabilis]|uniref:guanine nucleotide exchange factor still life isoform X8 n=1 Tax=Dermacentor variabilis TaxID=34621 RepID=UPI003F5BEB40